MFVSLTVKRKHKQKRLLNPVARQIQPLAKTLSLFRPTTLRLKVAPVNTHRQTTQLFGKNSGESNEIQRHHRPRQSESPKHNRENVRVYSNVLSFYPSAHSEVWVIFQRQQYAGKTCWYSLRSCRKVDFFFLVVVVVVANPLFRADGDDIDCELS